MRGIILAIALALLPWPALADGLQTSQPTPTGLAQTGQVPGTTTNDDAAAGNVGQYVTANVAAGSAVSLTTNTAANVTSISLTSGDWDVVGAVWFTGAGNTIAQTLYGAVSQTSATLPTRGGADSFRVTYGSTGLNLFNLTDAGFLVGPTRISLSTTTTVFLVAQAVFTTNTAAAYGQIRARRVR